MLSPLIERKERDYLLFTIFSLLAFGLVMIYSASIHKASMPWKFDDPEHYLKRQSIWLFLSSFSFLVGYLFDYRWFQKHAMKPQKSLIGIYKPPTQKIWGPHAEQVRGPSKSSRFQQKKSKSLGYLLYNTPRFPLALLVSSIP